MGFCYQKSFFKPTLPIDEAGFYALVRDKEWNDTIDKFRQTGDQALKRRLPAFIFQATFDITTSPKGITDHWRKQAATRLTGLVVIDVDHVESEELRLKSEEFAAADFTQKAKELGILLIYITPSGHGLKIVFKADAEKGNLIDNQHAMAKVLGVEVDESCKDASRMSFICKESDILYIDKELFTYENTEFAQKYNETYRAGKSQATLKVESGECRVESQSKVNSAADGGDTENSELTTDSKLSTLNYELKYHGVPYAKIVEAWIGDKTVEKGDRHRTSLILADHLRYITDNDPELIEQILRQTPFVKEIIEERNEDVKTTVRSALGYDFLKGIPKRMQEAIEKTQNSKPCVCGGNSTFPSGEVGRGVSIDSQLEMWGNQIEALFPQYPILQDICKGLKRNQYPAALFVAGGFMMTLMTRCTYRFYHRPEELRRLNNSTLIIGDPASGKSFASRLYKLLAAPIMEADKEGKDAINAYRELMRTKGANKDKPQKPKVIIRLHPARTSNAQFIQDMVNAVEEVDGEKMHLHMLTFDTELDNTVTDQKGGAWIDKLALELKAFHNAEDGQSYSNMDSVLQDFNVYWNYIYTGTPIALKKKVNEQNFGSGLATRLTCIPLPPTRFKMMSRESIVDHESDQRLKDWASKLDRMKGELPLQRIVDELYEWTARRMADAEENESFAQEMLLKRCAYHGLNFSAPFIVMRHWDKMQQDGQYWCGTFETDDVDWQLAELITNIQYACQRHYFGKMAETYFQNKDMQAGVNVQRHQKTYEAFSLLPEEFTVEDVMRCFKLNGESAVRMRIMRLTRDHLIEKIGSNKDGNSYKAIYRKTGNIML